MMRLSLCIAVVLCTLTVALPIHAQLSLEGYTEKISLSVTPANPEPGTTVHAKVTSSFLNLEQTTIEWFVDGKPIANASNPSEVDIKTKTLGTKTNIVVHVTTTSGALYAIERVLNPTEVDLLWSSDSYAPPFFRGKHQSTRGSVIKAQAIARVRNSDGNLLPVKDLIFTWRQNGALASSASGRGKNEAIFAPSMPDDIDTISVEISTTGDETIAEARARIPAINPPLALYQDHPLFGTLFHADVRAAPAIADADVTFFAIPYFAPVQSPADSGFKYSWTIDGARVLSDASKPYALTLNAKNPAEPHRIQLQVTHKDNWFLNLDSLWNVVLNSVGAGPSPFRKTNN